MTYDPKIFIRDYGTPTSRLLAFWGGFDIDGQTATLKRDLFLRTAGAEPGEQFTLLSGDEQSGGDLLELSGAGNDLLVMATNNAFRVFGPDVDLIYSIVEVVTAGIYSLTGNGVAARLSLIVHGEKGSFVLAAPALTTRRALIVQLSAGSFSLSGVEAEIQLGNILNIDSFAFTLTGANALLSRRYPILANAATFTLSRRPAGLLAARIMPSAPGAYTVSASTTEMFTDIPIGLSGDMQSGDDGLLLSGDMQSGTDLLNTSKEAL